MGMPTSMGMPPGAFGGNPNQPSAPADFPNSARPSQEPVSPFSIKDEGMPNAFSELVDPRACRPLSWQIGFNYMLLWYRRSPFPITATTGILADPRPAALNQPGTTVVSTAFEPGPSSAFRITGTCWLRDPELLGLDMSFFIMEQRSVSQDFASDANGAPVLGRPYFNPVLMQETAEPRSLPGIFKGTMSDTVTTRLMGADVNLKWQGSPYAEGSHFNCYLGARWLRFDERYISYDVSEDIGGVGFLTTFSDTFATYNQFFGGQVGVEWQYRMGRFSLGVLSKVAVGPNYQTIKINGETVQTTLGTATTDSDKQGLFAMPSNIGSYRSIKVAVLPEVAANLSIDLTDHLRFNVGYTMLLLNQTVRPGNQIDRNVNVQPLFTGGGIPPLVPEPPTFRQSNLDIHMLNVGLEFRF